MFSSVLKLSILILSLLGGMLISNCRKDNTLSGIPTAQAYKIESMASSSRSLTFFDTLMDKVSLENGMLVFNDWEAYNTVFNALEIMSLSQGITEELEGLYGITEENDSIGHIVLRAFEDELGFTSARRVQEWAENEFLENGGNPGEYTGFIRRNHVYNALMNPESEFQIGDVIIKHKSKFVTAYLFGGNLAVLQELRNKDVQDLRDGVNLRVLNDDLPDKYKDVFQLDSLGGVVGFMPGCLANFNIIVENGIYRFINTSMGVSGSGNYIFQWVINGVTINSTDRNFSPTFSFQQSVIIGQEPPSTAGPIEVTLRILGDCNDDVTKTVSPCHAGFVETKINENTWTFTASAIPTAPYLGLLTYTWNFGDGTTATGLSVTHTYPTDGTKQYSVTLTVSSGYYDCASTVTKSVTAGCGYSDIRNDRTRNNVMPNGEHWQMCMVHYTENCRGLMGFYVETTAFKLINGRFKKREADELQIYLQGPYNNLCAPSAMIQSPNNRIGLYTVSKNNAKDIGTTWWPVTALNSKLPFSDIKIQDFVMFTEHSLKADEDSWIYSSRNYPQFYFTKNHIP